MTMELIIQLAWTVAVMLWGLPVLFMTLLAALLGLLYFVVRSFRKMSGSPSRS